MSTGVMIDMKTKRLTIEIPVELHTKFKSICVQYEVSMREIVETLLDTSFASSDLLAILAKLKKNNKES